MNTISATGLVPFAPPETLELRDSVLAAASLIWNCQSQERNKLIVHVQQRLKSYLDAVEAARVEFKQPYWDACIAVDALAKELSSEAASEMMRLSKLAGDFLAIEAEKTKAANAARNRDLTGLELERKQAVANAQTPQELERIEEEFDAKAKALPVQSLGKTETQVVRDDWKVEVFDAHKLAVAHPGLVKIIPLMRQIKAALNVGLKVEGVTAEKVTSATVRRGRKPKENQTPVML